MIEYPDFLLEKRGGNKEQFLQSRNYRIELHI